MKEEWSKVKGFPNYEISNLGCIFRIGKTKRIKVKVFSSGSYIYCFLTDSDHNSKQVNVRKLLDDCFEDHIYKDYSIEDLEGEIWRDVVGWEQSYEVSNLGRIKTKARIRNGKGGTPSQISAKIKETYYDEDGYERVSLYQDNKSKLMGVHRIVAQAFIPNPKGLPQVNHKNGDKADNKAENLEWADNTYNIQHSIELGLRDPSKRYVVTRLSDGKQYNSVSELHKEIGGSYNGTARLFKLSEGQPVKIGSDEYVCSSTIN